MQMQRIFAKTLPHPWGVGVRLSAALGALIIGGLIYVGLRPASGSMIGLWLGHWPWAGRTTGWLALIHPWLPAFLHPFAMALITMALYPRWPRARRWGVCGFWAVVNTAFECGQLLNAPIITLNALPWLNDYFVSGQFDPWDIVAAGAGAALAAVIGDITQEERKDL